MPYWLGVLGLLIGLLILFVQLAGLAKQEPPKTIKTNGTTITSPQLLNE